MDKATITINNKTFKLKFGLKVFRLLGDFWDLPTFGGVQQKVFSILSSITDDISFEQLDVINDVIIASIVSNLDNTEDLTRDELDDLFLSDTQTMMDIIKTVFSSFTESLSQPDTSGKQPAPKRGAKKK